MSRTPIEKAVTPQDPRFAPLTHTRAPKAFDLARVDPGARPFSDPGADKTAERAAVDALALELAALQERLWADRRHALLVVLQGMDASGKDGTIGGVFSRMNALGVHATSWKAPTETEREHDFLWRIHARMPARGEVALFNRSHYEDVLVPVVSGAVQGDALDARLRAIVDFERLLADQGTVVLKFMLHISRDEQRERLQARIDDPTKHWKFSLGDLEVRKQWDAYQAAYARAITATGTPWAPWIVVPADSKTHRNRMVALRVVEALRALDLRSPDGDPALAGLKVV